MSAQNCCRTIHPRSTEVADMTSIKNTHKHAALRHTIVILLTLCFIQVADAQIVPVPSTVKAVNNEGAKPRNVVFILSDDHRYDAMSFMGHPLAKTPHMDAMAKQRRCISRMPS